MSDDNNTNVDDSAQTELDLENLDTFSDTFFGKNKPQEEPAKPSVEPEEDDTPEDVPPVDEDEEVTESDETPDEDDDDEEESKPSGKKPSRSQQRITELNTKYREAERREQEAQRREQLLLARLEALEKSSPKAEEPTPPVAKERAQPTPTDVNEDGTDKYPLGEFDPDFIRDLTRHSIAEATRELNEQRTLEQSEEKARQTAQALHQEWQSKQAPAQERYPDYSEKVASLEEVFSDVESDYGEYLAQTVMAMDNGPDVLYHLANHPDEARAIVKAGGTKAVLMLGRLEARISVDETPTPPKKKVSQAPTPPPTNKGSSGGTKRVSPDTDDLDAFAAEFFKRK